MHDALQGFLHYFVSRNGKTVKNLQKEANAVDSFFPTKYLEFRYTWSGEKDTITFLNESIPGFLGHFLTAYATAYSQ